MRFEESRTLDKVRARRMCVLTRRGMASAVAAKIR